MGGEWIVLRRPAGHEVAAADDENCRRVFLFLKMSTSRDCRYTCTGPE